MLLIECSKIKKYFGDKLILNIDSLRIYSNDRIGIVGINGIGKTTLINILSEKIEPDEGMLKLHGKYSFISQLDLPERKYVRKEIASKFGVKSKWDERMSGGEKTRFKLAEALDNDSVLIFADEPTSNVDIEGIELIEKKFLEYKGALVVISHDRSFLDKLCNQILEIDNWKIKIYKGNYSNYEEQKAKEIERAQFEYEEYINEKKRLNEVICSTKQKVKSIRNAPKRMGNSEARLHKMGNQKAKANLDSSVKNIQKRIDNLKVKEKPKEQPKIKLDVLESSRLHSKIIIEGNNINKKLNDKIIFKNAELKLYNGSKAALIGPNGCGKSTLIKMIMDMDNNDTIRISQGAKIGYFSQDFDILNKDLSIIENIMESSIYPENFARLLLARLLFKGESIYKKISILSGGERVKVSFAKILLQDINLLILDEPTNYVDINTIKVMEETLREYDRTLLFVSHDRRFISSIANQIMTIENHQIEVFNGNYTEYLSRSSKSLNKNKDIQEQIIVLKNRLTEVLGRLSMPSKKDNVEALDKEYYLILEKLKKFKE